jgi:hypothetical protein
MWYWFKQELKNAAPRIAILIFCVLLVAFAYSFAYDEYYNEKTKSLLFAVRIGGYLFGGCLMAALVASSGPIILWAIKKVRKKFVHDADTAKSILKWFRIVLWLGIALGLFAGFLLGENFLAGPKALVKWLIDVAVSIKEFFR